MFSNRRQKQLRSRAILVAIAVVVMIGGIWLNYRDKTTKEETNEAVNKIKVEESTETKETLSEKETEEETGNISDPETYLIRVEEGVVKVFLCDSEGNEELYLITSVPYDLLSERDQQLFVDGVTLETEDDLGKFLENFDS